MKTIAHSACRTLAGWIFEGGQGINSQWWQLADRIERRFKCVGCTESILTRLERNYSEAIEPRIEHIRMSQPNPYTHR